MRKAIFLIFVFLLSHAVFSKQIPVKCTYLISEKTNSIKDYDNANYSIKTEGKSVYVNVNTTPFRIKVPYPYEIKDEKLLKLIEKNKKNAEIFIPIIEKLTKNKKDYFSVVNSVLNFVAYKFKYSSTEKSPFIGDCNTAAKTTVKMLSLCNIPARIRYVIKAEREKMVSGKSLHAVVEIYYPQKGWAMSDPLKYHHFVPANYILIEDFNNLLGVRIKKKNCLKKNAFTDILKGKTIIYKLPNLFRYY